MRAALPIADPRFARCLGTKRRKPPPGAGFCGVAWNARTRLGNVEFPCCNSPEDLAGWLHMANGTSMTARRTKPPEAERLKVWVRSGGHCNICHRYLLESDINFEYVRLGELAHIVAQSDSERAPRGIAELPKDERDLAENLMLACAHCHSDIDKDAQAQRLDVEWLTGLKNRHETRIRGATELAAREKTVVLRLVGRIRGAPAEVSALEAADAANSLLDRNPVLTLDPNRSGPEIDLRSLPGEADPISTGYYSTACARIDQVLTERLTPAVERGEIPHLSVFGLARLPLLVYFGSRLDDAISTEIFQRHRSTESWRWETGAADVQFRYRSQTAPSEDGPTEALFIVNASGTINRREIPSQLAGLPEFVIEPKQGEPNRDVIRTRRSRDSFHDALSQMLGHIEANFKSVSKLHLFAAAPVSAAIILGRSVGWGFHPELLVYDAVADGYSLALEVQAP